MQCPNIRRPLPSASHAAAGPVFAAPSKEESTSSALLLPKSLIHSRDLCIAHQADVRPLPPAQFVFHAAQKRFEWGRARRAARWRFTIILAVFLFSFLPILLAAFPPAIHVFPPRCGVTIILFIGRMICCTRLCRTTSFSPTAPRQSLDLPANFQRFDQAGFFPCGKSICVTSPVITAWS